MASCSLCTLLQFVLAYVSGIFTMYLAFMFSANTLTLPAMSLGLVPGAVVIDSKNLSTSQQNQSGNFLEKSTPNMSNVSQNVTAHESSNQNQTVSPHLLNASSRVLHPGPFGLKFIHISKTGGTTVEEIGNQIRPDKLAWGMYDRPFYGYQHNKFRHFPAEKRRKYDWFLVVRDPVERFVSEYHCGFEGVNYMQARFHTEKDFNDWLQQRLRKGGTAGGHFIPQVDYLDPDPLVTQHIIKFENFEADLRYVLGLYNISFKKLAKRNNGQKRLFSRRNISAETMGYIRSYFAGDFVNFGYDMH
ncbi:unnamed protein product [Durusdinium trenchii]|uniref:Sulfotransferase family protein n=1 Tax=Durusdinium trenchii TaxID=1381693 RepID=A0ABP0KNH4_9DINO